MNIESNINTTRSNAFSSIRYTLSSKIMNNYFIQFINSSIGESVIENLLKEVKTNPNSIIYPQPLLISNRQSTLIPPPSPKDKQVYYNKSNETETETDTKAKTNPEKEMKIEEKRTEKKEEGKEKKERESILIPEFYKRLSLSTKDELKMINSKLESLPLEIQSKDIKNISLDLFSLHPLYSDCIFNKFFYIINNINPNIINPLIESTASSVIINGHQQNKTISKSEFINVYFQYIHHKLPYRRAFKILSDINNDYLLQSNFMPLMKCLLKEHEGLDFLKDHPDFQIKYSESVAMRIFYYNDINMDGRLSIREFYQSNILITINKVCDEKDINLIRDYFSYEHFYVLYCKFWELDSNEHTFLIDKEGFSKYDSHCLNTKAIDRIFQQIPRPFSSLVKDKMNFEDFLWYILSEEDKQSFTSITYWFRVMDIDSDGLLSPLDVKYFYDEQLARLEYSTNDTIPLSDILQQVYDMLNIDSRYSISLHDLRSKRQQASIFFNIFLNLNKFLSYEQRDPFQFKSEVDKYPGYSNWDLFALYEYSRISDDREDDDGLLEEVDEVEINN